MHADCEFCVKRDICTRDVPKPCRYRYTEEERIADQASDQYGAILNGMYLHKTYQKKKEETQMKATSVQSIENVKEMHFTIERSCVDEITKVIVGVSTNDDIFEFHFSGDGCVVFADQWLDAVGEKAYKDDCMELVKENEKLEKEIKRKNREINDLRQKLHHVEKDKERLINRYNALSSNYEKEISKVEKLEKDLNEKNVTLESVQKAVEYWADKYRKLEKSFTLEKAANEAQHKFIREYAGKDTEVQFNYAICAEGECDISYTIIPTDNLVQLKEQIENLKEENKFKCDSRSFPLDSEEMRIKLIDDLKKENEDLKKRYDRLNKKFNRVMNDNLLNKEENECKCVSCSAGASYEEMYRKLIDDLKEENKKLKEKNFCVKSRINAFKNTNGKLQDEVLELKYQLRDIQATKKLVEISNNSRLGILEQAKKCVCGQREQDYGTPESNFQLIADMWTDYLYPTLGYPKKDAYGIKATDVAMMMALMKIARIRNGGGSGDSFVDLAGYAACGGEIWHLKKEINTDSSQETN